MKRTRQILPLLAAATLMACATPPEPPLASPAARLLLIGIDGAAWDEMLPLLRTGDLPHLEALARRGFAAQLTTMAPAMSPVIWTTIATGKVPTQHGIRHFVAVDPATGEELPVTSNMRRARALWNILGDAGMDVGVVGWWVTWPAEKVNGRMVSPYAAPGQTTWKGTVYADGRAGQTWPPEYLEEIAPVIEAGVVAAEGEFSSLFPVPRGLQLPDYVQAYLQDSAWVHVSDTIFRDVGLDLMRRHQPRFTAVYFGGVDVTGHRFRRFAHPGEGGWESSLPEQAALGGAVASAYRWVDEAVGRLVAEAAPGTTVLVVSDHGMEASTMSRRPATPWNLFPQEISGGHVGGPPGIFILAGEGAGRNFTDDWWGQGLRLPALGSPGHPAVVDLAPTLLHLMGLPVGEDMEGVVLTATLAAAAAARPVRTVTTWEIDGGEQGVAMPIRSPRMEEIKKRLEGLGYIGDTP